ncbi:ABC transporter permease/substrate binding protein [Thermoflavimicrobium daqui]|uniref:Glycine/betaine ABC transporter permease n=1 Tax=Thermoflavimicrobium daqui TaxID=2137476 RepID=A0A364K7Z9_9BACL|nr:ABC transporter permease/substrate binding protein [Thermoflavimicrobium daqui]RAL26426.1 glycine/betaine ABC transporter permease [Thermoflavimicrobium daqui]
MNFSKIPLAEWVDALISWMQTHFGGLFKVISGIIEPIVAFFQGIFSVLPPLGTILLISLLTWWLTRLRIAIFSLIGLLLIDNLGYWDQSIETLSLVLTSAIISIIIGVPFGLWAGRSPTANKIISPILDLMQTMPAFVYLIPAVFFFSLGAVPGVIASVIFSMPPTIRLTSLGLRQVPGELREAADAFGSTSFQKLWKVEIPMAIPTIMAGINQTIMLSLSMVVISAMIGAGGLGALVLQSITRLQVGQGFAGGLAIVIIAVILDRLTQSLARRNKTTLKKRPRWIGIVAALVVIALAVVSFAQTGNESKKRVTLAYVNWDSEVASTHVLKKALESKGFKVEMKQVDAAPMWQGVASGTVDAHVGAWLPHSSKPLYDAAKNQVDDLGVNLKETRVGLVVPKYVTINSIEELNANKDKFHGEIIGIDPGSGLNRYTEQALKKYPLNFKLVSGSDATMTASLTKAIQEKRWIVVTGWTPHWKFQKYELKFLDDPKKVYGSGENIHTIARKGLKEEKPQAYQIIDRFNWTAKDMQEVMMKIHEGMSPDQAAEEWLSKHPDKLKEWTK